MPETRQVIMMDPEAEMVSLGVQNEHPVMYFSTPWPAEYRPVARVFHIMTTGDEYDPECVSFIGTVTLKDWYVAHVLEQDTTVRFEDGSHNDPVNQRRLDDLRQLKKELTSET